MKINKEHLAKYLEDNSFISLIDGEYFSIDMSRKCSEYDLGVLTQYLNSLDDSDYTDYLMDKFNKMPKYNDNLSIIKKDCGCGYGLFMKNFPRRYGCKHSLKGGY